VSSLKKNLYLFQPQYSVEYKTEKNYWIPYSIDCVWSYSAQFNDIQKNIDCKDIIFKRDNHNEILSILRSPDICAFSCYQWNKNYCLVLAEKIKKIWPECVVVFGGPEVDVTFLNNSFVDSIILGEGELAFYDLLKTIIANTKVSEIYKKQRIEDLELPSPYTSGVFDQIIQNNPDVKWATTLETNRGCPFSCTFCDWGSLTYSKVKKFNLTRVAKDLDWISNNPISYIFCADANFGIFKERDLEIARMVVAAAKKSKTLETFNATFNKNNNEWSFEILKILKELNRGFTVSVQSMNPDTLKAIKRDNLGINDLKKIFALCDQYNVSSYTELILGLPLETQETFKNGLCKLLELGQHNHIEIWFADMLVNSELATPMSQFEYKIKKIETTDYLTLNLDDDLRDKIQIVCQTSTMSTDDMIESFMYGWVIVNLHLQGYTQLTSKFYNKRYGIEFRVFYDTLIDILKQTPTLDLIYNEVKSNIHSLLYTGVLPKNLSGHNLIFCNGQLLYQHKDKIFSLVDQVVDQLIPDSPYRADISALQKLAIFDAKTKYPISITTPVDLLDITDQLHTYIVNSKVSEDDLINFNNFYYALRRKGALKNTITKELDEPIYYLSS
jgi:radical SAM superfamily enzyme YgiQ (UPF0313 family)